MSRTNLVRPSRDGDQFHYLWAARRCLGLLSAQSDLVAISIEGPSPDERAGEPPISVGEEVIDIAEYFGSEDFQEARLVRYMQLKHSTLHASEPWTASGLEKTIQGFTKRYQELLRTFSTDELAAKLQFWFVTNRPIVSDFAEAVADAAAETIPRHPYELQKLERFSSLDGDFLTAFLKLLHFEDRQDDYWNQRNILFQDVSGYLPDTDVDAPLKLKELVNRRALSEGEQNPTITKMDVLRALSTDERLLFPAPCLIESLDGAVPRAQESDIMRAIFGAAAPVIVHASAGVGKTVFANRIAQGLPDGSTCILYDCFGNGQYRNASGYRHRHRDALVQIVNELAAKGLCHLLIPSSHADAPSYVRAFIHRMNQAATLVRLTNPSSFLCIVVDAADNAQMAAEEIGEARSFVRDLIREKMPDNVRLVFLCRSHRQNYLDPPVNVIRCELAPFSREETAAHLKQRFSDASEHDIDEFHRLSSHNPRVQALALSRNNLLSDTLRLLGPNPTTVEGTIKSLLEGAIAKLKDSVGLFEKAQFDKICAGLAILRPLIPIPILSQMSDVDEQAIKSFAIDLGRPLLLAGDTIQFFDEPAETWFRKEFKPPAGAMDGFIANLMPLATKSAYVASVLPQLMLEAGKFSELVELALTSAALPETSPLEKHDVELQRLQIALKAGLRSKRYLDAAKLALKAGGETAGYDRQRTILQANTDLAATFLETDLIQEIVSRRIFGSGWLGSHHAYEAAFLSGRPELVSDARSRLRMAEEWLRNWSRLTPDERKNEEISDQDIVELTLANVNIHGPASGAHSLGFWRPREVSFRVGRSVARRLIDHGRIQDVDTLALAAGNNLWLVLAITVELREIQRIPPVEVTHRALRLVSSKRVNLMNDHAWDDQETALGSVTALVEAGLQQAVCTADEAAAVLTRYLPSEPPRALSSRFTKSRFPILQAYCLRAALRGHVLDVRDLAHPELRAEIDKKAQHSTSRDLHEFQEDIGALLPWHQLSASVFLGRVSIALLDDELKRTCEVSKSARKAYYLDDFHTSNEIALLWLNILHQLDAADESTLAAFSQWKDSLRRQLFTPTLTTLARLCGQKEATRAAALKFALEAFNLTKEERSDADSKSEGYIDAARAILLVSKSEAEAYFNDAVEVASKIGDENLSRWDAILGLADRAARTDRPSPEIAYHFARCAELTYDYVRDKHFDWESTIEALCGLCPASSLAILSRWRDRNFGYSERILPVAIRRLIQCGSLDARDAPPLIGFRAHWTYDRLLESVLSKYSTQADKEAETAHLYRYMQFNEGDLSRFKEITSRHNVTIDGLDEVIAFNETKKSAGRREKYEQVDGPNYVLAKSARDWDGVFSGCNLTNADGLSQAFAAFKNTESPWDHDQFFEEAIGRVPVGSEAAFIQAIGNVPELGLYHFRTFLEQVPDAWKDRPSTTRALAFTLKVFCRRYCMEIAKNRYYEVLPFKTAGTLAGMSEVEIVDVVLDAVGEAPDLADSNRLFSLVGLIAIKLSEDEALEALSFGLELFTPVLEEKDGDGPWSNELLPPTDVKVSLAGYIWASMAAPDAVIRWEGAHVVVGLVVLGRQDVLGHVFKFAADRKSGPFADARLPFYMLHARQWFLIGIARAAVESPAVLTPFANQLVDWALNDQPHVLIRQFSARAVLTLINNGALADRDSLKDRLDHVNVSPHSVVESKSFDRVRYKKKEKTYTNEDDRFYFGIDIGPYWYEPLGRVFAMSQNEVESEALKIIRKDFGYTASGRWDEDERSRRKLYEDNYTRHSHGSYPRADTLHFYLAYHAMMVVAGNLLASKPTHRDSVHCEEDEFADWLDRHDLSRKDGRWLWDRRDPTPQERSVWQDRKEDGDAYRSIAAEDFDEVLKATNMINVWGYWTAADSENEQSTRIYSALVSPDKSLSLLRALGTAKSFYDYAIPRAGSDMEIDKFGFSLKGWIVDNNGNQGLDGLDRWAGGISFPPAMPARQIIDVMGLETDSDRRLWKDRGKSVVMVSQVWGHYDEAKHYESRNPECGSRLQGSLGLLTSMLAKLDRDLIIEVQIERRRRYQPYKSGVNDDKNRIPTKARLYLLGADGQFRTL
ncbi:MAG: hypothetical protein A3K90_04235 [Pelodictyon luteolum]|uniref:NACHT domain-containing protein n=1 Tax=Pelodictyon luteolum TaxID=1100 RepID=A0A165MH04_PELLU|nr:AVAST type 3 anti-phage nuclease/ATPase Avs3a [Pelodictyon luteolum]KZK75237.1 MAG: hypothetical protein A3K90_04235 [Pelodictyon luteolum]